MLNTCFAAKGGNQGVIIMCDFSEPLSGIDLEKSLLLIFTYQSRTFSDKKKKKKKKTCKN